MLSVRPSIGWLSYYVVSQSPSRMGLLLGAGALLTLICLWEAPHTLNLTFQGPGPYPAPVIIIASPDEDHFTAWDACGIEAATKPVKAHVEEKNESSGRTKIANHDEVEALINSLPNPMTSLDVIGKATRDEGMHSTSTKELHDKLDHLDELAEMIQNKIMNPDSSNSAQSLEQSEVEIEDAPERTGSSDDGNGESDPMKMDWGSQNDVPRDVWVYKWRSTVFRGDKWAHFVNDLPKVHLNYFDSRKAIPGTELSSWKYSAGLKTQTPWVSWVAASLALLWRSGGIVLPTGVILTQPLTTTILDDGEGIVLKAAQTQNVSPLILGVPPQHNIVSAAMKKMMSDDLLMSALPSGQIFTPHSYLAPAAPLLTEALKDGCRKGRLSVKGRCHRFLLLPHEEAVAVDGLEFGKPPTLKTLLHYKGSLRHLQRPDILRDLFRSLGLRRFCPTVTREVLENAIFEL